MVYKYAENHNYSDYASGRVLLSRPGLTHFPVRLAHEIFHRCLSYAQQKSGICLYDPCCGGAYLLTVIGLLNKPCLKTVIASDVDEAVLSSARANLSLLTQSGLNARLNELMRLYKETGKPSFLEAAESAATITQSQMDCPDCEIITFQSDMLHSQNIRKLSADLILSDVPYNQLTAWHSESENAINLLLDSIKPLLKPTSIVALCSDKSQRVSNNAYKRLEKQNIGKRKFEILTLA